MPSNNFKNILILLLYLVIVAVTSTTPLDCPEHCTCTAYTYQINTDVEFNKAKCTSLTGLKGGFGKKSSLNSIDLSDLSLERMSTNLENYKNLTELNLSYNQLIEVNKLNKRITKLNLSHNKLESTKISKIPLYVQHLDLSYNQITYLPRDLMRLSNLRKLELNHNPIDCNCETIQVRNWLQRNRVWSDSSVKCMTPALYRDRSWLQVKESEVCSKPKTKADIWNDTDDDEMMLGDAPVIETGSGYAEGSGDDIHLSIRKEELLPTPINGLKSDQMHDHHHHHSHDRDHDEEESSGSGGSGMVSSDIIDEEDGSGSGSGILIFPEPTQLPELNGTISYDPPGIFEPMTKVPVVEETISRNRAKAVESEKPEEPKKDTEAVPGVESVDETVQGSILKTPEEEKKDDQNDIGVYILLIVIGVVFVALLIFVAMKRKQQPSKRTYDPELARGTELKTMDRNNLGKPTEFLPLMGEKPVEKPINAADAPKLNSFKPKPTDDEKIREPLLKPDDNGKETSVPNGKSPYAEDKPINNNIDNLPNGNDMNKSGDEIKPVPAARTQIPIVPVHETRPNDTNNQPNGIYPNNNAQPVDSSDDVFLQAESPTTKTPPNSRDDVPVPDENDAKPKSPLLNPSRYSPVYSPETGRVKIKLTNLPKPKTPLLVNRSRSNAGDIIFSASPDATRKQ